jgi:hypothetical protein
MTLFRKKTPSVPGSPPAIWESFERQTAYKSWIIVALLGVLFASVLVNIKLASRPPEYVVVDGATGDATLVKHSLSNDALLRFIADKTKPPKMSIFRFTRDFLHLALAVNSSTIEKNWPAALALMNPSRRAKLEADAAKQKLVEIYKLAQRKTDLEILSMELTDRSDTLLAITTVMRRQTTPLLETMQGPRLEDRIKVETILEIVPPTVARPDGLQVLEWNLGKVETADAGPTATNTPPPAATVSGAPRAN